MKHIISVFITLFLIATPLTVPAQQELAQQVYLILDDKCLTCHGPNGSFTENLVIDSASGLVNTGAVVPGQPFNSNLYTRLITTDKTKRMPLGGEPLDAASLQIISDWIVAGAPQWNTQHDVTFIPTDAMLTAMQGHLEMLDTFDRPFARYFTMTHLYNASVGSEALNTYRAALSKLVNSLSWGFQIINPEPIDVAETLFYIDLRNYEWDIRDAWTRIEAEYPYAVAFDPETQTGLLSKLNSLRSEMHCEIPFVHVDWFLATASLPPLYHDILTLPETEQELERELRIDVNRNLQSAPGVRVWRAGTNNSGVSSHNRVVERHTSPYGAYWKSHDFAGSVGAQNIFTYPLSFQRDGGEVIFNLPNGLQAYYVADGAGNRIDVAPTEIVSDPAARSNPAVRNGLSCIGCHTEGMKDFEDSVRAVIEQTKTPAYDKDHALRLYVEQSVMEDLLAQDIERYKTALEATGGVFGGIEPVHRFYETFQAPLEAPQAAAAVGLQTETFLKEIREKPSLQNLGLTGLTSNGNVKRDAWTAQFSKIIIVLQSPETPVTNTPETVRPIQPTPSGIVLIPDLNLRDAIERQLGKNPGDAITPADMEKLTRIEGNKSGIQNLKGLEYAINLEDIRLDHNAITDLTPLTNLTELDHDISLRGNQITDVTPLARLFKVRWMQLQDNQITDLFPLQNLKKLREINISGNPVTDLSPLAGLIGLEGIAAWNTRISDFSPLANLPRFRWIEFGNEPSISALPSLKGIKTLKRLVIENCNISDISGLAELSELTELSLQGNSVTDISALANLKNLTNLNLAGNWISDISSLANLKNLTNLNLAGNWISDISSLANLKKLIKLDLDSNLITDFSPLESLLEITSITANGNPGTLFSSEGPKITGPWLWMIVSTGESGGADAARSGVDFLAHASRGEVTELKVATHGATEGNPVGDKVWTIGALSATDNNLNTMANATGFDADGNINKHVAYGSLVLESPKEQQTTMLIGSDDAVKVWLNGELVHYNPINRTSSGYQDQASVTLTEGKNVLLVAVYELYTKWSGFFGFTRDTEYTVIPPRTRFFLSTDTREFQVDSKFVLRLNAANMEDLAGWQTDVLFDPAILKANSITQGSLLKQGNGQTYFRRGTTNNEIGRITGITAARATNGGVDGDGTLLAINFTLKKAKGTRILLRNFKAGNSDGKPILATSPTFRIRYPKTDPITTIPAWDVNEDGLVNILDIVLAAQNFGKSLSVTPRSDVNGDGVINILDIVLVAQHLGESTTAAASATVAMENMKGLDPVTVQAWIEQARAENDGSIAFQQGIANLERLLASLIPEKIALLPNYPNPFNPETWIPYQLAEPAEVALMIYAVNGTKVRTLVLGLMPAGIYQSRSRAAYWDGKNEVGELVASGVYIVRLDAGDFSATRRMVVLK